MLPEQMIYNERKIHSVIISYMVTIEKGIYQSHFYIWK